MNQRTGNGDICPENPEHGRMWMMGDGPQAPQFCPHSDHSVKGENGTFAHDGKTPRRVR